MGVRDWSKRQVVLLWLVWLAVTVLVATALDLVDICFVTAQGAAVGVHFRRFAWILLVAFLVPSLLTLYWRRARR
jgi:hypothetical protein